MSKLDNLPDVYQPSLCVIPDPEDAQVAYGIGIGIPDPKGSDVYMTSGPTKTAEELLETVGDVGEVILLLNKNGPSELLYQWEDAGQLWRRERPEAYVEDDIDKTLLYAQKGGILPQVVTEMGVDDEPILSVLFCDSISGGRAYDKGMPRELSLVSRTRENSTLETRASYKLVLDSVSVEAV